MVGTSWAFVNRPTPLVAERGCWKRSGLSWVWCFDGGPEGGGVEAVDAVLCRVCGLRLLGREGLGVCCGGEDGLLCRWWPVGWSDNGEALGGVVVA